MINVAWHTDVENMLIKAAELDRQHLSDQAIASYKQAYALIPEPRQLSELSTIALINSGELHYLAGEYEQALEDFSEAVKCKNGLGNAQIHFRLGQLRYLRGELERATDELIRAYMGAGRDIFDGEDDKYFNLIQPFV